MLSGGEKVGGVGSGSVRKVCVWVCVGVGASERERKRVREIERVGERQKIDE